MSSKIDQTKTSQNEIASEIEKLQKSQNCRHCKNNEKAEKPFAEMKNVKLTPLTEKVLDQAAKQFKIKEKSCLVCLSIKNFCQLL